MKEYVLEQKQAVVDEIVDNIQRAKSCVLVEYRGLNVAEITDLRALYRNAGVNYKVYKNTMMVHAFNQLGVTGMDEYLKGPNAVAFSYDDEVTAAKITKEYSEKNEKLVIKAGYVDGTVVDNAGVKNLATIPSREVLVAMALGGLNAPIAGLANASQGLIRNMVYALNSIKEKKENEAA